MLHPNYKNRKGKIRIPLETFESMDPEMIAAFFANFHPQEAQTIYELNGAFKEFLCLSQKFRELNPGTRIPFYSIEIRTNYTAADLLEKFNFYPIESDPPPQTSYSL